MKMLNKALCFIFRDRLSHFYSSTIISVADLDYDGMVYNLSIQDDETYIADGFVVHNCRTQQVPELNEEFAKFDKGATRSSKGSDGAEKVSSTKQYYDWLKSQPASFQDDTLGRERGKIFRSSGLTPQEFRKASVDRLGNPLTIEEMAKRDSRIRDYLQ